MAFGEFCCPYCEELDFNDQDDFFEHVCNCQANDDLDKLNGFGDESEDDEDE